MIGRFPSKLILGLSIGGMLLGTCSVSSAQETGKNGKKSQLSLEGCVELGLANQPAMAAAQSSLDAAQWAAQGLNNLPRVVGLLSRDLPYRRQQACLGITIAEAALEQAEWETRYAVTRNYFSVIYARDQVKVVTDVLTKLNQALDRVKELLKGEDPKTTKNDQRNLEIQIALLRLRLTEATIGIDRANAALREAIGMDRDSPLEIAKDARLPDPVPNLDLEELVTMGLERRGEMVQASSAEQVTNLEVYAQQRSHKIQAQTFAAGGDVHAKPIPQGVSNNEYRPGAIGLEMPPYLTGKKGDRVQRAQAYHDRAGAVVDKTQNLIVLEVQANYYKWKEALDKVNYLKKVLTTADELAESVTKQFNNKEKGVTPEMMIRARTQADQVKAQYNEALYNHALALAALERVTAGGYRPTYEARRKKN
jgi:outer membrane protein TolC